MRKSGPAEPLSPSNANGEPGGGRGMLRQDVQLQPPRFARSSIPAQNRSHGSNVISDGSPSRIRMVRRISLGITTRPRSSMRRTMPVAFISKPLLLLCLQPLVSAGFFCLCRPGRWFHLEAGGQVFRRKKDRPAGRSFFVLRAGGGAFDCVIRLLTGAAGARPSSSRTSDRSLRRIRQSSFPPSLLLSPRDPLALGSRGDPVPQAGGDGTVITSPS